VEIGIESGDRVEIRHGVSAGDLIVTSGQFLIDSESNIEAALSRMDDAEQPMEMDDAKQPTEETMDHSQHQMEPSQ
jgi:Cu(I)/Ag(I) efflux system membrane fusion protein